MKFYDKKAWELEVSKLKNVHIENNGTYIFVVRRVQSEEYTVGYWSIVGNYGKID